MTRAIIGMRFSMLIPRFQKNRGIETKEARNAWLQKRIEIFNTVTARSLQQHENIIVMLFMAEDDIWVYEQLNCDDRYVPVYSNKNAVEQLFMSEVEKIVPRNEKIILMRMDSDDAIHKDYFAGIDDEMCLNTYVVNPVGLLWNGHQGTAVDMVAHQFTTAYTNSYMSPFRLFHTSVSKYPHTVLDKMNPMWLTYIHGDNVGNEVHIQNKTLVDTDITDFIPDTYEIKS